MAEKRYERYLEYLQSAHWRALRDRAFARAQRKCEACPSSENLHGHHVVYREPLESCTDDDVMALCSVCHDAFHTWQRKSGKELASFTRATTLDAIAGIFGARPAKPKAAKPKKQPPPLARNKTQLELLGRWDIQIAIQNLSRKQFKMLMRRETTCGGKLRSRIINNALCVYDRMKKREGGARRAARRARG